MRLVTTFILIIFGLKALAQTTTKRNWIDSKVTYSNSADHTLTVTNSLPKGGARYTDPEGNTYSYVIFWHRVTNTSKVPLELAITFPAKPLEIFPSTNSHIRLFLPTEPMTSEKIELFDYGLSNLKVFLDAEFYEPNTLEKTINPEDEYIFYTSVLIYQAQGSARAALVMKGLDVFYQIAIGQNSDLIPCGQIAFKN